MKRIILFAIVLSASLHCQESVKTQNVVIYNQNLGVVREVREMNIKKGVDIYSVTNIPEKIDPTSVKIKLDGEVLEQNFKYDLAGISKILNKYINKEIMLIGPNSVSGILLSTNQNQIVIKKKEGGLIMLNDIKDYQISVSDLPLGFITQPTLEWLISSNKEKKQDIELTYQTEGLNWHTEYIALLNDNDKQLDLNAWISLENNSGMTFKDANLQLIAGDINREHNSPILSTLDEKRLYKASATVNESSVFEYHLYNVEKPTTIANNEIKQISMFDVTNVNVKKEYFYYCSDNSRNNNPKVIISFENTEKNNLGMPMPMGKITIFKKSDKGSILLGEDRIQHTPKNEIINVEVGKAFDVVIDEIMQNPKIISNNYAEYTEEIQIRNRKNEDIEVNVSKSLYGDVEIKESTFKLSEQKGTEYIFKVPVNKDSVQKFIIKYRIRTN